MMPIKGNPAAIYDSDGSVIVLHMRTGKSHLLNSSAGTVWRLLEGGSSLDEAIIVVAEHYGISPEEFHEDLSQVIEDLVCNGFLEGVPKQSRRRCFWRRR